MTTDLTWPTSELPAALAAVAAAAGLAAPRPGPAVAGGAAAATDGGAGLGLDVQPAYPSHDEAVPPALVPAGADRWLAVLSVGRRRARVVTPTGAIVAVPVPSLGAAGDRPWLLVRSSPGTGFWRQCREAGLPARVAGFVLAHAAQYGLFLWSWAVLGRATFAGRVSGGTLTRWALLLAATVPARVAATRLQAGVAVGAGWLLRRRILHGTLRLQPDDTRREGAGQLLGRSLEAEAVEDLAIGGGLLGLLAAVELAMAVAVLAAGPGLLLAAVLLAWAGLTVAAGYRYVRRRRAWAAARLTITHDLIEKMVGHRTRLVQQAPEHWHDGEEERLEAYAALGRGMDRWLSALVTLAPRGWMVLAVGGLGVALHQGASPATVAVGAGGILLALSALSRLVNGLAQLGDAAVAWSQVAPLFDAAARPAAPAPPTPAATPATPDPDAPLVEVRDAAYRYTGRDRPALSACSLRIGAGERLLLEGPSGSGKSTFAALLAGLRTPTDGALRLGGADQADVGVARWRRRVVASPQFHENHVVLGPLVFNLLLGRRWPPEPEDLRDAYQLCVDLGLGSLLDRMPSGLQQMVGDTGWQLSHGERSLVFLARALLQDADLVLLDETFGSLDPETMGRALAVALERARTLVVIRQ